MKTVQLLTIDEAFEQTKDQIQRRILQQYPNLTPERLEEILLNRAKEGKQEVINNLGSPIVDTYAIKDYKIPSIYNSQSKNQQKRCAKGLHIYNPIQITEDNITKIIYQCKCGEIEKHYRNKI